MVNMTQCDFGCFCKGCAYGAIEKVDMHCDDCWDRQYQNCIDSMIESANAAQKVTRRRSDYERGNASTLDVSETRPLTT